MEVRWLSCVQRSEKCVVLATPGEMPGNRSYNPHLDSVESWEARPSYHTRAAVVRCTRVLGKSNMAGWLHNQRLPRHTKEQNCTTKHHVSQGFPTAVKRSWELRRMLFWLLTAFCPFTTQHAETQSNTSTCAVSVEWETPALSCLVPAQSGAGEIDWCYHAMIIPFITILWILSKKNKPSCFYFVFFVFQIYISNHFFINQFSLRLCYARKASFPKKKRKTSRERNNFC